MSESKDFKFCLKVMMNKEKNKVLFAEADSSFADVLISFITMPLGTIVRILKNHYGEDTPAIGSLTSLYNGIGSLDSANFWSEGCKETLLNPTSPFEAECRKLRLDISDTQPDDKYYYFCDGYSSCANRRKNNPELTCRGIYYDAATCRCGLLMGRTQVCKMPQADNDAGSVFTINTTTSSFIISDELKVFPNTTGLLQTLRNLGITGTSDAETCEVTFDFNEIMALLRVSLLSRTPLTDLIVKRDITKYKAGGVSLRTIKNEATLNSKKMILKVILENSTNKLVFAQADEEFVDILCSLLAVPLGGVEYLLGGNSGLNSIDNLYTSIVNMDDKNLATPDSKARLVNPKLPHGYISEKPILPLKEDTHPSTVYTQWGTVTYSSTKFLKGKGKYVRGPGMYEITDDLTVRPLRMTSLIAVLDGLNIPLHDLQELELEIGLEQALSILKASLTSSSALTDGLMINTMLRKQPKQEH